MSVAAARHGATFASLPYTATVANAGPQSADGVSLVIEVDPAWSAITRPTGCTQSMFPATRVTCSLGTLASGESATRVHGRELGRGRQPHGPGAVTAASPADPVAANNSETETTTVSD